MNPRRTNAQLVKAPATSRKARARRQKRTCAIVASLEAARAALGAARTAQSAITLVSPPGSAANLGIGYFWALIEAATAEFPDVAIAAVMDCGDEPGWALAALRTGFKSVALGGDRRARDRVAAIARKLGARVLARPPAPSL